VVGEHRFARQAPGPSTPARGKTNDAIAGALRLHRATVEKHINSIFLALGLAEEKQVNKRVSAVLLFLRDV